MTIPGVRRANAEQDARTAEAAVRFAFIALAVYRNPEASSPECLEELVEAATELETALTEYEGGWDPTRWTA
jgi:hypothetical protein